MLRILMPTSSQPSAQTSARNQMMDLLARREHTETEIREKLLKAQFPQDEIESAIRYGQEQNWLPNTERAAMALATKIADGLHCKNKGILFINHYLTEKGHPPIEVNEDLEIEKARRCLETKSLRPLKDADLKLIAKCDRLLTSRGFEPEVIRKVLL